MKQLLQPSYRVDFMPSDHELAVTMEDVRKEIVRSYAKHPKWPVDLLHGDQIINEEKGEATRALLNAAYEGASLEDYRKELVETAAMCLKQLSFLTRNA